MTDGDSPASSEDESARAAAAVEADLARFRERHAQLLSDVHAIATQPSRKIDEALLALRRWVEERADP